MINKELIHCVAYISIFISQTGSKRKKLRKRGPAISTGESNSTMMIGFCFQIYMEVTKLLFKSHRDPKN